MTPDEIRRDERHHLAELLRTHADTIGAFAVDPRAAVLLVALLIEIGNTP